MSTPAPEMPRPVRLDTLGDERAITIEATGGEKLALARRFGLIAIDRLDATVRLTRDGERIAASGHIDAAVTQACVATGEPVAALVDEDFSLVFLPESMIGTAEEIELSEADCDTIAYAGGEIDVGEAVAETMALALDPFPRAPGADAALKAAGVLDEGDVGPFSGLKALRDKLGS